MAVRREEVRVDAEVGPFVRKFMVAGKAARTFASDLDAADSRMSNLVQSAMALGPALVPLAAAAVPALAGLSTQLGIAAVGAGTVALAFNGVGDALGALNEYHLDPTAKNLEKVDEAMAGMAPAAESLILYVDKIRPQLERLQDAAQNGLLPGVQDGLADLMARLPEVEAILSTTAKTMGTLAREGGEALSSEKWDDFFSYVDSTARPIMLEMGRTLGNFVQGTAELWMAVDPLSRNFSTAFLQMSRDYSTWADNLEGSEGLESFIDYLGNVGPQAWDTLGSVAEALTALVEAAAPVGSVALPVIELLAETLTVVAGSDVGPVLIGAAAGIAAISRAVALYNAANGSAFGGLFSKVTGRAGTAAKGLKADAAAYFDYGAGLESWSKSAETTTANAERMRRTFGRLAIAGAGVGLFAAMMTDLDDKMGLSNTTMLGLMGLMAGPWGGAAGAFVGATMDAAGANDDFYDSLERVQKSMRSAPDDFAGQTAGLEEATRRLEAFKESVTGDNRFTDFLTRGFTPSGIKNNWEGIFGTSDIEEQEHALASMQKQLQDNVYTWNALNDAIGGYRGPSSQITDLDELSRIARQAQPAMDALGITLDDLQNMDAPEFAAAGAAIREYLSAQDSTAGRTQAVKDAIAGLDDELVSTTDSASSLANALEALLNPTLNAEQATDAYRAGLQEMRATMEENRKTFQGMSEDALENREATRSSAADIVKMVSAQAEAGASAADITGQLGRAREALIREGMAAGFSREQMERRTKALGLTPKLVRTVIEAAGVDEANSKVAELKRRYDLTPRQVKTLIEQQNMGKSKDDIRELLRQYGLTPGQVSTAIKLLGAAAAEAELRTLSAPRTAFIYTRVRPVGGSAIGNSAAGNLFEFYAGGGVREQMRWPRIGDQYPQIRPYTGPAGLTWSEEGSGPWEAFISGQPARKPRSKAIAEEVVARLGGEVQWRAANGLLLQKAYQASGARTAPSPHVTVASPTVTPNVSVVAMFDPANIQAFARTVAREMSAVMSAQQARDFIGANT